MQYSSHSLDCGQSLTHPPLPLSPLCTLHFPSLHYVPSTSPLSIMYPPLFPSLHYVPSTSPLSIMYPPLPPSPLCTLHFPPLHYVPSTSPLSIMYPPLPLSPLCTLHFPSLHYVPSTSPLSIMYFNVYMFMLFSSMVGNTVRGFYPGQPPNHDQHLGLGHRPTQWWPESPIGPCRQSGVSHSCYMPGCGLPPLWAKHNHEPQWYIYSACKSNQMALA